MNQIDQSLDDIIKQQRLDNKKLKNKGKAAATAGTAAKGVSSKGIFTKGISTKGLSTKGTKIPKQTSGGIPPRTGIRTERATKAAKSHSPYARPGPVQKEIAIFSESYKAAKAPVKEIFTAGYIAKPASTIKLFTTNNKAGISTGKQLADTSKPLSVGPLRLVTTQKPKQAAAPTATPTAPASFTSRNDRGRAAPGASTQSGGFRGADTSRTESGSNANNRGNERNFDRSQDRNNDRNSDRSNDRSFDRNSDRSNDRNFDRNNDRNFDRGNDRSDDRGYDRNNGRRVASDFIDNRSGNGNGMQSSGRGNYGNNSNSDNYNYNSNYNNLGSSNSNSGHQSSSIQRRVNESRAPVQALRQEGRLQAPIPAAMDMDMDMDMEQPDGMISIKGSAPGSSVAFRGESGPVTVEIENLDPGTTSEDVKYVCSRFGEILSCVCSHGFSQVTYARKVAGQAAVDNLHGKKADNGKVLRVTMLKNPVMHQEFNTPAAHVPTPIAGPMKLLTKAVHGTITNAGTIYSDHLLAAQTMLKVQQHRMAQLHQEEERIKSLRLQAGSQQGHIGSLSTPSRGTAQPLPDDSPAAGRQRVRTEPSPRHQHTSSTWLGPYNEQLSPAPASRSPRGSRQAAGRHSPGTLDRTAGSGPTLAGSDRIMETHRALGWQLDGSSSSSSSGTVRGLGPAAAAPLSAGPEGAIKRRDFEPRHNDTGFAGPLIEPSTSVQSLVESIDDDHVFKLTELTKKRVEHNNPAQKRQRVVSLPATEAALTSSLQPSEKTLVFSSTCKAHLESKYAQLYQSINAGHPINRLQKLREVLPRIKEASLSRPSLDLAQSRPRRSKSEKYRFVDKVEESSCIWDVDHMEAKAAAEATAEAAALARQTTLLGVRNTSQQQLSQSTSSLSQDSYLQSAPSTSTESLRAEAGAPIGTTTVSPNRPVQDSPSTSGDLQRVPEGVPSPRALSSTQSSKNPIKTSLNSASSSEVSSHPQTAKDAGGESKVRSIEHQQQEQKSASGPAISFASGTSGEIHESSPIDTSPSKRSSFLGIFGGRGKKVGQDGDHIYHHESPQSTSSYSSPRLTAINTTQERRSFESQHSPHRQPTPPPAPSQRTTPATSSQTSSPSVHLSAHSATSTQARRWPVADSSGHLSEHGEMTTATMTDEDSGGHWAPPVQWPQGERMDDSQDESDSGAANMNKRSSLRRLKDRMTWKRGNKALSAIQQGESVIHSPTSPVQGRLFSESNKSQGKKTDPALAYLQGQSSGRLSTSQPSSGRNSLEGSSRPKLNFRVMSGTSSPVLDPLKSPEAAGTNSPRTGPINGSVTDPTNRLEKSPITNAASRAQKSPMLNPARTDKSPMIGPASSSAGEEVTVAVDSAKQNLCVASQLMVDVERIPKRLLQQLKARPDLASIDWSSDTVDLSVLWSSSEPVPTYHEYIGISSAMKASQLYPSSLDDIDVLDLQLVLSVEEPRDVNAKNRARKWDMLELRVDEELHQGEKWIKEVERWSENRIDAVERHQRAENPDAAVWHLNDSEALVEEPDEEDIGSGEAQDMEKEGQVSLGPDGVSNTTYGSTPSAFSMEALKARKQRRDLSLISGRGQNGSMSSFQTSMTYTFKTSLESTRESVKEMRVFLAECRQRLQQLHEATGAQLREKEPVFKEVVDKFTMEWNESYFVKLKEVEDQIQVMNLKRIENPWMDMLLILLSWLIRGLFYIVEGVTIMIIIGRHAWSKAKHGYGLLRNARQGQERLTQGRGGAAARISLGVESQTNGEEGSASADKL
ncbi:hypothetical protein EC968_006132 [Mortierella alpina]|nr:hypothetical protein EC968_006132 [Mortierella alpina]